MGHLTLISEDVIGALEHFPPDLRLTIAQYSPQPEWDEYVTGRYKETKKKDTSLLGGGKPVIASGMRNGGGVANTWKVDEAEAGSGSGPGSAAGVATSAVGSLKEKGDVGGSEANGEMRRGARNAREASTDFGTPMEDDDDDEFHSAPPHVSVNLYYVYPPPLSLLPCWDYPWLFFFFFFSFFSSADD